jgi:hypothetical protein
MVLGSVAIYSQCAIVLLLKYFVSPWIASSCLLAMTENRKKIIRSLQNTKNVYNCTLSVSSFVLSKIFFERCKGILGEAVSFSNLCGLRADQTTFDISADFLTFFKRIFVLLVQLVFDSFLCHCQTVLAKNW